MAPFEAILSRNIEENTSTEETELSLIQIPATPEPEFCQKREFETFRRELLVAEIAGDLESFVNSQPSKTAVVPKANSTPTWEKVTFVIVTVEDSNWFKAMRSVEPGETLEETLKLVRKTLVTPESTWKQRTLQIIEAREEGGEVRVKEWSMVMVTSTKYVIELRETSLLGPDDSMRLFKEPKETPTRREKSKRRIHKRRGEDILVKSR